MRWMTELPETLSRKFPRYRQIPAPLTGHLAADIRFQGQGLGSMLLFRTLERACETGHLIGAVAVVEAINGASAQFYVKYDFQSFQEKGNRLFIPMKTIESMVNR